MHRHPYDRTKIEKVVGDVIASESAAVARLADSIDQTFFDALDTLSQCHGRVIVSGMGKMSAIARKMSATLCSTGTPAVFLHPAEAVHGDLGIVSENDVLLALSNSGETEELIRLVPYLKRRSVPLISITGSKENTLASHSNVALCMHIDGEADENTVAPTNSTTACLALCDALAVALVHVLGFTTEQFAQLHPGGNLGRRLLLTVGEMMHTDDRIPLVSETDTLRDTIVVISQKTLGAGFVVDDQQQLLGIITDGDLRRILQFHENPLESLSRDVMTSDPKTVTKERLAAEAMKMMQDKSITVLPVVEDQRVIGAIHMHDLLRAGFA